MRCGCGNRYSTNNVNICINVTKNTGSSEQTKLQIAQLKQKVSTLSGNVNIVSSDVQIVSADLYNLSAQISPYLSAAFTTQEIRRLKILAEQQNFNALTGCIQNFNGLKSIIYQAELKVPEGVTQIDDNTDFALVSATLKNAITQEVYQTVCIKDETLSGGFDHDIITQAVIPISGFILGIWVNPLNETNPDKMQKFVTSSILYKHQNDKSALFLTRDEVKNIYNQRFKTMKICALKLTITT